MFFLIILFPILSFCLEDSREDSKKNNLEVGVFYSASTLIGCIAEFELLHTLSSLSQPQKEIRLQCRTKGVFQLISPVFLSGDFLYDQRTLNLMGGYQIERLNQVKSGDFKKDDIDPRFLKFFSCSSLGVVGCVDMTLNEKKFKYESIVTFNYKGFVYYLYCLTFKSLSKSHSDSHNSVELYFIYLKNFIYPVAFFSQSPLGLICFLIDGSKSHLRGGSSFIWKKQKSILNKVVENCQHYQYKKMH